MWLGVVKRYSGKTSLTEAYLSFPSFRDKVVVSSLFGKSSLAPVNEVNVGYANTDVFFTPRPNCFIEDGDRLVAIKTVSQFNDFLTSCDYITELSVDEVRDCVQSKHYFMKTEGDSIVDSNFVDIDFEDSSLKWYSVADRVGQEFIVSLNLKPNRAEIVHAFFPITVGIKKWYLDSCVGVATEGVTICATQYVCCKTNNVSYQADVKLMEKINDLACKGDFPSPYVFCFKLSDEEINSKYKQKLTQIEGYTDDFVSRRASIYKKWKMTATTRSEPVISQTLCSGLSKDGGRVVSFAKSPLLLQLDGVGSLWLDSLVGYVFSSGKSYLAKALNSDVVQAAIQTTYSFLTCWYPPFKSDSDDPVKALGSWENICSGIFDPSLGVDQQKLTGEFYATHRLIENRNLLFPLLTFHNVGTKTLFCAFCARYNNSQRDYTSHYIIGSTNQPFYKGEVDRDNLRIVSFNDINNGSRVARSVKTDSGLTSMSSIDIDWSRVSDLLSEGTNE